jgi:hypothetical protein
MEFPRKDDEAMLSIIVPSFNQLIGGLISFHPVILRLNLSFCNCSTAR